LVCVCVCVCVCVTWCLHTCGMIESDCYSKCTSQDSDHSICLSYGFAWHCWHPPPIIETWLLHTCDLRHDSFAIFFNGVWHDSSTISHVMTRLQNLVCDCACVKWLIHTWDMTPLQLWHDSFAFVTRLLCICDKTHLPFHMPSQDCKTGGCACMRQVIRLSVRHDSPEYMTWLIYHFTRHHTIAKLWTWRLHGASAPNMKVASVSQNACTDTPTDLIWVMSHTWISQQSRYWVPHGGYIGLLLLIWEHRVYDTSRIDFTVSTARHA